ISPPLSTFPQPNQLRAISLIPLSKTIPISTPIQLLPTTLFTPIFLPQSTTRIQLTIPIIPILLLLTPIPLTSLPPKNQPKSN
ncbi:GRP family sugar transporter, partial [Staphylococcus haemolyticus]|uniref:GRP family sugar transporter n=1 Tax=Staphylococcus haemolyticus TaxID=1283 RepID=UPI001C9310E0